MRIEKFAFKRTLFAIFWQGNFMRELFKMLQQTIQNLCLQYGASFHYLLFAVFVPVGICWTSSISLRIQLQAF